MPDPKSMTDPNNGERQKDQAEFRAAVERAIRQGFGAVLRLEPADADPLIVDGRGAACVIGEAAAPDIEPAKEPGIEPTCVWRASRNTFLRALEGGRALEGAYMSARLHVSGDMSVIARLQLEPKT